LIFENQRGAPGLAILGDRDVERAATTTGMVVHKELASVGERDSVDPELGFGSVVGASSLQSCRDTKTKTQRSWPACCGRVLAIGHRDGSREWAGSRRSAAVVDRADHFPVETEVEVRSKWTLHPWSSVLEGQRRSPSGSWIGLFLMGPRKGSGNRRGADQVLPASSEVVTIPHQLEGEGPPCKRGGAAPSWLNSTGFQHG